MRYVNIIWVLLLIPIVYGGGFSSQYLPDNKLDIYKGESGYFNITLQNIKSETTINHIKITDGANIAKIVGNDTIELQPGSPERPNNVPVSFLITPQKNVSVGDEFPFSFTVQIANKEKSKEKGMITFSGAVAKTITIRIIERPFERTFFGKLILNVKNRFKEAKEFVTENKKTIGIVTLVLVIITILTIAIIQFKRKFKIEKLH